MELNKIKANSIYAATLFAVFVIAVTLAANTARAATFTDKNSPAINAGNNALAVDANNQPLTTDQRGAGFARIVNATVDIGAFELKPTAAGVSVSGRILTASGKGIAKARVSITDAGGNTQTITTNRFGFYQFTEIPSGETYILSVKAGRYRFTEPTQVVFASEDLDDIDFTALP